MTRISKTEHLTELVLHMETYTKHRVECFVCSIPDSVSNMSEDDYAESLYKQGWRYIASNKLASMGVVCPKCANTPDDRIGEW